MEIWKAHYRDSGHDIDIEIVNSQNQSDNYPLSFVIDGFKFVGQSVGDFELYDESQAEEAEKNFCLMKCGGYNSMIDTNFPYFYNLQRYSMSIDIPVCVVRKSDNAEIQGFIHVDFELKKSEKGSRYHCDDVFKYYDDYIVNKFYLTADGKIFKTKCKSLWFESGLQEIYRSLKPYYSLKCCFTCQYSDYSPYGSDDFGTMLCYRKNKSDYLKVNSKADFFEYLDEYEIRQETFVCEEYEPRVKCGGYRGFID
ncbi:MAG: hypothetical protein K2J08_03915 [Ruminococcus sp.]|nr:hypothetical protein [Ruminococcus sp.]